MKLKKLLLFGLFGLVTVALSSCKSEDDESMIKEFSINKKSAVIYEGQIDTLFTQVKPIGADVKGVQWSPWFNSVVTVIYAGDKFCCFKGISAGKGFVKVEHPESNYVDSCEVTVLQGTKTISLSSKKLTIERGESYKLEVTIWPENATDKSTIWSSVNENVAKVDQFGNVTAVAIGTTDIICKSKDGFTSAKCTINVQVSPKELAFDKKSIEMLRGEKTKLDVHYIPNDATLRKVTWSIDDSNIAYVSNDGSIVAKNVGKATVKVISEVNTVFTECELTVTPTEFIEYHPYDEEQKW